VRRVAQIAPLLGARIRTAPDSPLTNTNFQAAAVKPAYVK
jgi:hypothetical protein